MKQNILELLIDVAYELKAKKPNSRQTLDYPMKKHCSDIS